MISDRPDIIAIGEIPPDDGPFVRDLLQVAKAPLGWHGEFCARYFLGCPDHDSLPMGVVMCLEPLEKLGRWVELCDSHTLVLLAPNVTAELARVALSRGVTLFMSSQHQLYGELAQSGLIVSYDSADDLITKIYQRLEAAGQLVPTTRKPMI